MYRCYKQFFIYSESVLECKTAVYEHPFAMDIDLDFYRSEHHKLVGREWPLNELDEKMFFSKRGVLFLAGMGYGKSAIVSHLICQSDKRFPGNWIHQHIVVYHMCNFYSRKTLSPGNFVNNLAGGFSKGIPGFLYNLQQNVRFNLYFEYRKCIEDPEGCLDTLVLKALTGLDMGNSSYIVLIDALDECIEYGELNIFNLLWKRLRRFPLNIKFLMTSRYISDIKIAVTQLDVIEKNTTDPNNVKDAHKLLLHEVELLYDSKQSNMQRSFESSDLNTSLAKAVQYAQGNILLIKYALPVWLQDNFILRSSYTTFEDLFEEQLTRIFDRNVFESLSVIKTFEVLCATMEPLHVEELIKIANLTQYQMVGALAIIGKELSHFIRRANDKISLIHKSLAEYLTNESRKTDRFYVSKKNGCVLIGKYWLDILRQHKSFTNISVVDFASYIACSSDEGIRKTFLHYGKTHAKEFSDAYILHQAAAKLNSEAAMSLILDLFSLRSVDETDDGNITASYVAAAFGNHLSLKALLDRNSNVNFIRLGLSYINETVDMLHFCKTFAFWEYSLLNIAAQNGHYETVQTLLRHNVNISHQTSFGSNSFLLAVENGHARLVRDFLIKFKSNFSSSLNQALYLSAKNGYLDLVDLLLYHGAEDFCPLCNSSQYWTTFHQTRLQAINSGEQLQTYDFAFLEDRRFIRCESVLEIAIQNGHTDIIQRLLGKGNNTLRCREAGGRTPVFTALKFKRTEIFKILVQRGINKQDRCLYRRGRVDAIDFNERERKDYLEKTCPYNVTLSYYLAFYWNEEVFALGQHYDIWNWTARDTNGATPVHYACCAGNSEMINLLEQNGASFDVRSSNGSTPAHSAAICRQNSVLSRLLYRYPRSVFDNENRSISHYVAMSVRFRDETTEDIINKYEYQIFNLKKKLHEEIFLKDELGKSPLHYACESGNVNLFIFYYEFSTNFSSIITSFDNNKITFLDAAFANTPILYKKKLKVVDNSCNIFSVFSDVHCDDYRLKVFVPHEYMVYLILKSTISHISGKIGLRDIERYVNISLQRNNAHLLGIIFHNFPHEYNHYMFKHGIASLKNLLKHPEIDPVLFSFLPDMIYDCSKITGEAVLHDIVQDEKRTFWTSKYFTFSKFKVLTKSLELCVDGNGYNFLQRSVIGGNVLAFRYFTELGMSCSVKTRDGKNLLQLLVDSAPCFEEENHKREFVISLVDNDSIVQNHWIENTFSAESYNVIAFYLAINTTVLSDMKLHEVCNNTSETLSFSHKVAGKGLITVLAVMEQQFGSKAVDCFNKNNVSTGSLLLFFKHHDKYPLPTGQSNPDIVVSLFLKVVMDFKPFVLPKLSVERKCNYRMRNHRNIRSMGICVLQLEKEFFSIWHQYVKVSGLKSKKDFKERVYFFLSSINDYNYLNSFHNILDYIKKQNENENPTGNIKLYLTSFIYDKILNLIHFSGCLLNRYSLKEHFNSTECCRLISLLPKTKKLFISLYTHMKIRKMLLLIPLYQHFLNIPFKKHNQVRIKDDIAKLVELYARRSEVISIVKPEFFMQKGLDFWDFFKSCKNSFSKKMIKEISSSTVREIQKWRGSPENMFTPFSPFIYISKKTKAPLEKYNSLLEQYRSYNLN